MAQKTKAKASKKKNPPGRSRAKKTTAKSSVSSAPSAKQQFLDSFERESATTLKLLRALPPNQSDFRPHMRSKSARELAFTFVGEQMLITKALTDQLNFTGSGGPPVVPNDFQAIINQFENGQRTLVELIRKTPDAKFNTTVQFPIGPGQMGDWSKIAFAWFILSDQIHHRGQFSVYVRMAGGKVPSIYGPSADEPWR